MPQSPFVNILRDVVKSTRIYRPELSAVNLVIELPTGLLVPNAQLNQHGSIIAYLHCIAKPDTKPQAVYQDGSDSVYFPIKGRLYQISDEPTLSNDCLENVEHDVNPESRLHKDFDDKLLLWPGQQLKSIYNGRQGIFVPMIALPHPYDLTTVCGLKIRGSWKLGLS